MVLPYIVFRGTRKISCQAFNLVYSPSFKVSNVIELKKADVLFQIAVDNFESTGEVNITYIYSRPARFKDPLHRPNRQINEADAIPEEFYLEVSELPGLGTPFKETFDVEKIRKERILNWLMRTSLVDLGELKRLRGEGLVVIGDAVHALPVLGGDGANVAVTDAVHLANILASGESEKLDGFYDRVYESGRDSVEGSVRRLRQIHAKERSPRSSR